MYKSITTAVAVLALAGAGAAFAQTTSNSSGQPTNTSTMHGMHHMHHMHGQHMRARLAKLKTQLKITAAQESAWNGFAQAAENMRPAMSSKMKRQMSNRTAPEVFDGMAQ